MKNKVLLMILLFVGFCLPSISVDALTKIDLKEQANGQIKMNLHFEEGFVGGIDLTLNVDGNVSVSKVQFSDKIIGQYDSNYHYDEAKKTLNLFVTTGGIGVSHNLLNQNKELDLGTIYFDTSMSKSTTYELSIKSLKIVDNSWTSKTIAKEHLTLGEQSKFTYQVTNPPKEETKPEKNPSKDEPSKDEPSSQEPDEDDNVKDSSSEKTNSNTSSSKSKESKNISSSKINEQKSTTQETEKEVSTIDEDKVEDVEIEPRSKEQAQEEEESIEESNHINWRLIITGGIIIIAIGSGGYYFVMKRKKKL